MFSPNDSGRRIKQYINNVKYKPFNRRQKVVTDMKHVSCEPMNIFGMNLNHMFGGILKPKYWEKKSYDKLFDRNKILRDQGIGLLGWDTETASSCDENE